MIGGRLADKYETYTKAIVLVSGFVMTVGSSQYAIGYSVWNLLAARLICGKNRS
jgi:MFS family permease